MATAFVIGHGGYDTGKFTFVPRGWKVHFHADADTYLIHTNALAAVSDGTVVPRQTYSGGADIPNYGMTLMEDDRLAGFLASQSSRTSGVLFFVGAKMSGSGYDSIPIRSNGEVRLCTSRSRCSVLGKHGPSCRGLFRFMARRGIREVHLLCCRAGSSVGNASRTIALGAEPVHPLDPDVGVVAGITHARADDRHYPSMIRGQKAMDSEFGTDRQAQMARLEQLPQAVVAAMPQDLPDWAGIQAVHWPARRVDAPAWFPDVLITSTDPPPDDLPTAWQDDRWRNAFWLYCHGPGAAAGNVVARLLLYSMLRTHTDPPVVLLDENGNAHYTERVLDSEILHFCQGSHGRDPGVDRTLVRELEAEIGTSARLFVAARGHGNVKKSVEAEWVGDLSAADAYPISLQRVRAQLRRIEHHVLPELQRAYQEFRDFHARWWQVRWGEAVFGPGAQFSAAWATVIARFAARRADLEAIADRARAEGESYLGDHVQHFVELFGAMSGAVEEAWQWRGHLDTAGAGSLPFADRVTAVRLQLEAAAFNAQLMEQNIRSSTAPEISSIVAELMTDVNTFVTAYIKPALDGVAGALAHRG